MSVKIVFQGVWHECSSGKVTIYSRVASAKKPREGDVRKLLAIPPLARTFISPAPGLWPGEEKSGPVWEVITVPSCQQPMVQTPSDIELFIKGSRRQAAFEREERKHPPITLELPTDDIPGVIGLQDGSIQLVVSQRFSQDIWPIVAPVIGGEIKTLEQWVVLTLPVAQVRVEFLLPLDLKVMEILDPSGNVQLLFHNDGGTGFSHIHTTMEALRPVFKEVTDQSRKVKRVAATLVAIAFDNLMEAAQNQQPSDELFASQRKERPLPC